MKVGDLVKFRKEVAGPGASRRMWSPPSMTGIVVEINGDLLRVMWSNNTLGIELPSALEVTDEDR